MVRSSRWYLLLLILVVCSKCAPESYYIGVASADSESITVENDRTIVVKVIDGQTVPAGVDSLKETVGTSTPVSLHLKPGTHQIDVGYYQNRLSSQHNLRITFSAKAGESVYLCGVRDARASHWHAIGCVRESFEWPNSFHSFCPPDCTASVSFEPSRSSDAGKWTKENRTDNQTRVQTGSREGRPLK